jgi:hypothetical protein
MHFSMDKNTGALTKAIPDLKMDGLVIGSCQTGRPLFVGPSHHIQDGYITINFLHGQQQRYMATMEGLKPFRNKTVVDLGAGDSNDGFVLAYAGGATGYIAVEPNDKSAALLREALPFLETHPAVIVQEDIINFIPRIPDESVCFIISALSNELLFRRQDILSSVPGQISRTLARDGAIFFNDSDERLLPQDIRNVLARDPNRFYLYLHGSKTSLGPAQFF